MRQIPYNCSIDALVPIALVDKIKRDEEDMKRKAGLSPELVLTDICQALGEPLIKVTSKSRKREYVLCRMIYFYVMRRKTRVTLVAMGEAAGGRDHTTAIHSIQAAKDYLDTRESEFMKAWDDYLDNSQLFTRNDFR